MKKNKPLSATSFNVLSDAEKERIYQECESITPDQGRAMNAAERRNFESWRRSAKARRGRPRLGLGAARINITVEKSLLERADSLARKHKISRSEAIAQALQGWIKGAA